jgi:hypothetical protein
LSDTIEFRVESGGRTKAALQELVTLNRGVRNYKKRGRGKTTGELITTKQREARVSALADFYSFNVEADGSTPQDVGVTPFCGGSLILTGDIGPAAAPVPHHQVGPRILSVSRVPLDGNMG